jgi:hypothetical protein
MSSTQITAVSPPGAGTVDVIVTVGTLSSPATGTDQFAYQPTITSINPMDGMSCRNTQVTITGMGFTSKATVMFGSVPAASVTFMSSTQITAVSPPGAGTVDVIVTVGTLSSPATGTDQFAYQPTITSINPMDGMSCRNTQVTITGMGFTSKATVMFGSVPAASVTFMSSTQITAVSPAIPTIGRVAVTVTVGTLSSAPTLSDLFTYFSYTVPKC